MQEMFVSASCAPGGGADAAPAEGASPVQPGWRGLCCGHTANEGCGRNRVRGPGGCGSMWVRPPVSQAVAEALGSRKGASLLSAGLEAESPLWLEGWERTVRVG